IHESSCAFQVALPARAEIREPRDTKPELLTRHRLRRRNRVHILLRTPRMPATVRSYTRGNRFLIRIRQEPLPRRLTVLPRNGHKRSGASDRASLPALEGEANRYCGVALGASASFHVKVGAVFL